MATKHDVLKEEELAGFSVNPAVTKRIESFVRGIDSPLPKERINVLDWGCGRGRSVAKLLEQGFNAYGADIDEITMRNGYELLELRGYNPPDVLIHVDETSRFENGFFHIIFSEQVFHHVANLTSVAKELSRLTKTGGIGIHCFPGSKNILEGHLSMPFIHWLPKNVARKVTIALLLKMGKGPTQKWPETLGKSFWGTVGVYYDYLNGKTYYRDIQEVCDTLRSVGFEVEFTVPTAHSNRWLPAYLRRNGFPHGTVTLFTVMTSQDREIRPNHFQPRIR